MSWCPLGRLAAGVACPGRVCCCGFSRGVWRGRVELVCRGAGRNHRYYPHSLGARVLVTESRVDQCRDVFQGGLPQVWVRGGLVVVVRATPQARVCTACLTIPRAEGGFGNTGRDQLAIRAEWWHLTAGHTEPVVQRVVQSCCASRHRAGPRDLLVARLGRRGFRWEIPRAARISFHTAACQHLFPVPPCSGTAPSAKA